MNFRQSTYGNNSDSLDINLTPLIDVVFLLLIFFMVSSTFSKDGRIDLNLPAAGSPVDNTAKIGFELAIDGRGQFYIDQHEVVTPTPAGLKTAINAFANDTDSGNVVLIRADGKAPHQALVTSLDVLGKLGYSKIQIATANEK